MDAARSAIVSRVAELGLSLSELSLKVGKNHAYFQQFIKRGVPNRLPEEVRGRVAEILGLDERLLKEASSTQVRLMMTDSLRSASRGALWIPLYGHAVGGKDGEFILSGNQVSEVLAPPNLSHVPDAYAVYVVGDSMEPRYFAGETVFVNPRLPIGRGSFVVAQISKGQEGEPRAYVKRFVSQDAKRLRLEQYNPKKVLEFPISTVTAIHRIVMSGENR
ncbi:MAG TPA: S24 family peptidase [Xanthobacteraceae bacterium]|jgi:phage repressor protein C with HTH and peptisase S24 domain|nr:S24 family peptidase [Xanthobacteraceae bacterium]